MIIAERKRAILVNSRQPGRLLAVLPRAKPIEVQGRTLVAVPHRIEEVRVLRNLGVKAPSPILHYYTWPAEGGLIPFAAQKETAAFLTLHSRAHVHNDIGTGKTLAALWAYDYLRREGVLHRGLIVAPLSTLNPTWMAAIEDHLPHLAAVVVHGSRERRQKLLERPADLYIINHDGVAVVLDALAQRADIDLVVIDEVAQVARNAKTRRWTTLNAVVNHKTHKRTTWGMTGTPTPNAPTDAYGQAKLITPGTTPPYFTRFRDQVMRQAGLFAWVPREDATERVHALLQPAIRFSRDECVDLPPTTYTSRHVPLTREQQTAYDKMKRLLVAEAAQGQILAVNEGVKISKLVQIACGAAYAVDGSTVAFNATPRLTETVELIREAAGKTLVFVPFISALHMVAAALEREGITVGAIYGETNRSERDVLFASFQRQAEPQVLVCQPAAMSHGLTLTQASTIIWYAPITSAEIFEQANGRITRPGQRHNTLIVQIEGSDVERRIYKRLREKQHMQGLLLDMVRDGRE